MDDDAPKPSFSKRRRWLIWFNTVIGVIAVLALVGIANYFASGYFKRFQISAHSHFEITPQTTALLQRMTNQVDVTIFYDQQKNEEIYSLVLALLKQYSYANPNIHVQTLDYTRSAGKAAAFLAKYQLGSLKDNNFVVFDSGGRPKVVYGKDLYDYDLNAMLAGSRSVRRNAFKGELLFSAAIFGVIDPRRPKAYFVYGHGEHDPENIAVDTGYGKFAALLKDELNMDWEKLALAGTNEIPADCQLLVVAGPGKAQFQDYELAKIEAYLKEGRRLLVMLNNLAASTDSGIEKTLQKWNVGVENYKITDAGHSTTGDDLSPVNLRGEHPVMKSIAAESLQIYLVLPRMVYSNALTSVQAADAPQVEVLAATSTNAVGKAKFRDTDGKVTTSQIRGILPLVVAVEHGSIKNVTTERGVTRILVVGDSLCFDNQLLDQAANHYFASSAVNWLIDRPQMLLAGIGPRPIKEYRLMVTGSQMKKLQWILLAGMPGAILLFGGLVWLRRRS
ncbi:MAG: Gldg family protein [Verrucomicrobiota bacterium]